MSGPPPRPDGSYWRLRPCAPQPGTLLGTLDEIPDPGAKDHVFCKGKSAFSMFVGRRGDSVYGYLNICPHYSSPLNARAELFLNEAGTRIRCTMHFAEFRIEDGFGEVGAPESCWLEPIGLSIREGMLYITTHEEPELHGGP